MAWSTTFRHRLYRVLRVATVAVALWLVVSFAVAYRLTRRPHSRFDEPAPAASWARFEPRRIETRDGHDLGAWLVRGGADAASVLLLHGNGGSRRNSLDRAEILAAHGATVLLVSLRAHGDSTGDYNDLGYGARNDVVAAVELLGRERPGKPIVILGSSMGAAAAVLASEELSDRVGGYVLECPFSDLKTAVWNRTENALPPVLDRLAYQGLVAASPFIIPELERISPLSAVVGVPEAVPILILAGGRDRRARPEEARSIHARVKSHARLSIFDESDHVKLLADEPERYTREVIEFLQDVERRAASGNR